MRKEELAAEFRILITSRENKELKVSAGSNLKFNLLEIGVPSFKNAVLYTLPTEIILNTRVEQKETKKQNKKNRWRFSFLCDMFMTILSILSA